MKHLLPTPTPTGPGLSLGDGAPQSGGHPKLGRGQEHPQ